MFASGRSQTQIWGMTVLDTALCFEARAKKRQVEREPRKKIEIGGQVFRQSEATGSGIAVSTNIVARGQGNQAKSVTQSVGNIGGVRNSLLLDLWLFTLWKMWASRCLY